MSLIIALFFGLGVSAFYEAPKAPDYPVTSSTIKESNVTAIEQSAAQTKYDSDYEIYRQGSSVYNRNTSMITLGLAVIALIISLLLMPKIYIMSNGLMLGGVFTLIYSMICGFATDDTKYRFIIVCLGLVITLALGYLKFIKPKQKNNS
jgi:hypothetical protein